MLLNLYCLPSFPASPSSTVSIPFHILGSLILWISILASPTLIELWCNFHTLHSRYFELHPFLQSIQCWFIHRYFDLHCILLSQYFFWWYFLYLFVVTTFLAFSCIFFVQVLFIISYHHSVICFIINNHVFYDVFTFINLLVCMPHLYFWYNLIVSSYVFLVTFIFFKSNIYVVSILIIYPSSLFISILGFSSSISYYCSKSIFTLLGLYSIQKVEIPLWSQVDPAL